MRAVQADGLSVSAVGLGTWQFGSREWGYGRDYAHGEAARIVERALELGVTLFDTAELYGRGRSERILGEALGESRDRVVLASKWAPFVPLASEAGRHARGSARRLGADHLDLYQVHWPNPVSPAGSMYAGLAKVRGEGLVRHLGVSNHSLAQWRAAEAALGDGTTIVSNQVEYNLLQRSPEDELVPWAAAHDRLVIAYSPLAQGAFAGRWDAANRPTGLRALKPLFSPSNMRRIEGLVRQVRTVAAAHDATPAQVGLAWLLRRPQVVVIPGASSVAQLEANVAAADLELSADEDVALGAAADACRPVTGLRAVPEVVAALLHRHG